MADAVQAVVNPSGEVVVQKPAPTLVDVIKGSLSSEPAKEPAKTEASKQLDSERFAQIARREKALFKKQQEFKAQQAAVDQKIQQYQQFEALRQQVASNPLKAMEVLGISYQQLTDFILNGQKPTAELEVQQVRREVEAMKQQREMERKQAEQLRKQRADSQFQSDSKEFDEDIAKFMSDNTDKYELVTMHAAQPIIRATIEQHYKNTKKIMDIEEATKLVEDYLEEQVKNTVEKSKKFQAKQMPKEGQGQANKETGAKSNSTPTLTNAMTSSAPSLLPAKTEADRISRAMAALSKQS
jgi:hypothetical protein